MPTEPLPCPSGAEVEQIQRDVPITFLGDPTAGTLVCRADEGSADLSYVQASLYQALVFLRRLSFDRPLPWTPMPLYEWLRILGVSIVVSIGTQPAYYARRGIYFFYPPTYRPPAPPITIQQTPFEGIVHEARHADGPVHSCDGKDERVDELGSFGAQYYLLKWIADYSRESRAIRDYANYRAWDLRTSGGAFCFECQRSGSGKAALDVTITPNPILAVPVGSAGFWGAVFESRITETAGVDVTITHVDFTIHENATGRVASQQTLSVGTTIRAWSSLAVSFNTAGPLRYSVSGQSHEATLSVVVEAKDANGNTITQSASADIK